jgi:hypothetical protein
MRGAITFDCKVRYKFLGSLMVRLGSYILFQGPPPQSQAQDRIFFQGVIEFTRLFQLDLFDLARFLNLDRITYCRYDVFNDLRRQVDAGPGVVQSLLECLPISPF